MRRLLLASALAFAASAGIACAADLTGTVNVTGTVAAKCSVVGGSDSSTFTGTIDLGELAQSDGTLNTTLTGSPQSFQVRCNSGAPTVTLTATALTDGVTAGPGYTSTVDYVANLDLTQADLTPASFTYATKDGSSTGTSPLSQPLANQADNVVVSVSDLNDATATDVLTAGNYSGVITVTIDHQ